MGFGAPSPEDLAKVIHEHVETIKSHLDDQDGIYREQFIFLVDIANLNAESLTREHWR